MKSKIGTNNRLSSRIDLPYPDFTNLPDVVQQKFDGLSTKVNFFRIMGYSPGTFVEIIDLTNAIFKNLTFSDYYKELLVLLVAANQDCDYEWEQHVSIAQAAGINENQFISIAENQLNDLNSFTEKERILLQFGRSILENGKAHAVVLNHALEHFSIKELADAMLGIGFYRMLSAFIQTFDLELDPQEDGNWVKG